MKDILEGDDNFQEFSRCCEKKACFEKQLEDSKISDEKKSELKERIGYLNKEISGLRIALESKIKTS